MSAKRGSFLRAIPALLLVVAAVYVGMQIIPVASAAYQFDDAVREQVVYAGARRLRVSDEEVRGAIMARARELGLPVTERNIVIRRTDDSIRIAVATKATIGFVLDFTYDWTINIEHEGPAF